jgi:SNF2 family DNA or RNA helicase
MVQEVIAEEESLLIFTQFTEIGESLAHYLKQTFYYNTYYLHGGTSQPKREKMIEEFQNPDTEPSIFILSLKAGGVGITLTKANHVFHFDRWWNPAVETQATDRAYRIGQKKPVTIWIPQAIHPDSDLKDHSFDLRLHDLLEYKRQMSRDLLAPTENREKDTDKLFNEVVSCN